MSTKPYEVGSRRQNLQKFVRALRREMVGYHNRTSAIKSLRREFRLDEKPGEKGKEKEMDKVIQDVVAVDAEAKQIRIQWADERVGRVLIGEKGEVVHCVIMGEGEKRDVENERRILGAETGNLGAGKTGSMLEIGERLKEGIY